MHQVMRRKGNLVLEMDLRAKRGKYVVHDPVNHEVPLIRTDDYQRAMDIFTVRVELRTADKRPEEYARECVVARDGRRLIRTVDRGTDGLTWKYISVDGEGHTVDLGGCIKALMEVFGQTLVDEIVGDSP